METILLGAGLGFAAGISPGPLLTLVLSTTLERGFWSGFRVALAPLLTDAPIILLALFVLRELPGSFLQAVSLLGGLFVLYLGVDTLLKSRRPLLTDAPSRGAHVDLGQGALVNLLSPHPWIFWVSVGGPLLLRAWHDRPASMVGFLLAFYLLIVGCKVTVAYLTAGGRSLLRGSGYTRALALSGSLLVILALFLIRRAF
jgi:threonine/homoserine/homoserine lactone efflux protein